MTTLNQSDRLVSKDEASRILGVGQRTMDKWRYERRGPQWVRIGRLCRYRVSDLYAWIDQQPTFDPEARGEAA
jgi:predicted DNA-binding transcriptional regulator AlpA